MKTTVSKFIKSRPTLAKLVFVALASFPVVAYVFKFSLLQRNGIFRGEDWDYFAQAYEAARLSILHYHQFPWWNPWVNGGQPLYANPQFGLISIQTPFVLLFGTIAGLHYSLVAYFLLGFWGMYLLLLRLGSARISSIFLSYIWVFSGFNAWHLGGGHLTFAIYLLSPWAFLTVLNIHRKRGWLWFGLVASLLIQSAAHYLTFEALTICALIVVVQIVRHYWSLRQKPLKKFLPFLKPYTYSALLVLALCAHRLIYTLQFTNQFPRLQALDPPESFKLFIASLTFRHPVDPASLTTVGITHYGWTEYADYCGLLTLALFSYLVIRRVESVRSMKATEWLILGSTFAAALITLGDFGSLSPFTLLHDLPVFKQMRVPSRFLCWVVLGVVLFLAKLPRKPVFYFLLVISALDVFQAGYPIISYPQAPYSETQTPNAQFIQHEFYHTDPALGVNAIMNIQDYRLLRATQNNVGEVYGYEPILNVAEYYYSPKPRRCGIEKGCEFVRTGNAVVTSWSPQKIILSRTGAGTIELNMNPGKFWYANDKPLFTNYKILDLQKKFLITDQAKTITVQFKP